MEREYNLEEALKILMDCYLTDSIQTLRKWIREGKINATVTSYRQGGYKIMETDLISFIEEERPGLLDLVRVYKKTVEELPLSAMTLFKDHVKKIVYFNEELNEDVEIKNDTQLSSSEIAAKNEMQSNLKMEEVSLSLLLKEVVNLKQHVFKDEYSNKAIKTENNEEKEINTNSHQSSSEVLVKNELQTNSQREEVNMADLLKSMEDLKQNVNSKFEKLDKYEEEQSAILKKIEKLDSQSEEKYNKLISEFGTLKEEWKEINKNEDKKDKNLPKSKAENQKILKKYDFQAFFKRLIKKTDILIDNTPNKAIFESLAEKRYKLFYDDENNFLEKKYFDVNQNDYEMKIEGKSETLNGKTRGELMKSYFNEVFYPELKQLIDMELNPVSPKLDNEDKEGDTDLADLGVDSNNTEEK